MDFDDGLSATAIQGKKEAGLERCRLFRINFLVHGKFRYGTTVNAVFVPW